MRSEADGAKNPRTVGYSGVQMVSRQLANRGVYSRNPRAVYTDQVEEIRHPRKDLEPC